MKILVLGGDGYLGYPTAMHFAGQGHNVTVVDNYLRRHACTELDVGMLYPVPNLHERAKIFQKHTAKRSISLLATWLIRILCVVYFPRKRNLTQ